MFNENIIYVNYLTKIQIYQKFLITHKLHLTFRPGKKPDIVLLVSNILQNKEAAHFFNSNGYSYYTKSFTCKGFLYDWKNYATEMASIVKYAHKILFTALPFNFEEAVGRMLPESNFNLKAR